MHIAIPFGRLRSERPALCAAGIAVVAAALTVVIAESFGLPLRDPDGIAGPAYVRLPGLLLLFFALDVIPRGLWRAGSVSGVREVIAERWPRRRLVLAVVGLISFYLTYVAYRNLKSFLPFVREGTQDAALLVLDRTMALGKDPATLLHSVLGTGIAAHVLSSVYLFFLVFVPISLGVALVWSKDIARGYWYVTALGANWLLGTLSYYALPSLGPVYARPELFSDLPVTGTTRLQESLLEHRLEVLANPFFTNEVSGIAGFASLHVAIVFTAAMIAQLLGLARIVRWSLWLFLVLTVLATIYFGWHYLIDDLAGFAIGALAVWIGAVATGHRLRGGRLRPTLAAPATGTLVAGAER